MINTKLKEFFLISENIRKYNQAVDLLRDIGFEDILILLNSNESVDYADPHAVQMAAFQQAESVGWLKCVSTLFNFLEMNKGRVTGKEDLDYGAREQLRGLGYNDKEIEEAIKDDR